MISQTRNNLTKTELLEDRHRSYEAQKETFLHMVSASSMLELFNERNYCRRLQSNVPQYFCDFCNFRKCYIRCKEDRIISS